MGLWGPGREVWGPGTGLWGPGREIWEFGVLAQGFGGLRSWQWRVWGVQKVAPTFQPQDLGFGISGTCCRG